MTAMQMAIATEKFMESREEVEELESQRRLKFMDTMNKIQDKNDKKMKEYIMSMDLKYNPDKYKKESNSDKSTNTIISDPNIISNSNDPDLIIKR